MHKTMRVAAALAALTMMSVPAFAQGGPPGGFGGFGGGQFGRGGGGELSVVQVPLETLSTALKLTPEQSDKIKVMQDKLAQQRQAMRPPQGGFGGGGFDREAMQQMMEEMRAKQEQLRSDETKTSKALEAMLTPDQATALKAVLPGWKVIRQMNIDLKYADSLKLTAEQIAVLEKAFKERAAQMQGGGRRGGGNKSR